MTYNIQVKHEVYLKILKAYLYYEDEQNGLVEKLMSQIEKYLELIKKNPFLFQLKASGFREAFIQRFPYFIVSEVFNDEVIVYTFF